MHSTYYIAECLCSLNQTAPIMQRLQKHVLSNSQKCDVTTTITGIYKALCTYIERLGGHMLTIEEYNFVEDRLRRELNFIETIKLINALDLDQRTFEEAENPAQYVYYCGECDVVTQLAIQFDHYASPEYLYKAATYYFEELQ